MRSRWPWRAPLRAVEAHAPAKLQAEPLHGPQPDMLDADRTRADQLQSRHPPSARPAGRRAVLPAMRWACRSTSSGQDSGTSSAWRSSSCWIRLHSTAQCRRSTGKSLPRLSRVRWRTFSPLRSERTRRCDLAALAGSGPGAPDEHRASIGAGARVGIREHIWHYIAPPKTSIQHLTVECRSISSESCAPPLNLG